MEGTPRRHIQGRRVEDRMLRQGKIEGDEGPSQGQLYSSSSRLFTSIENHSPAGLLCNILETVISTSDLLHHHHQPGHGDADG